MKKIQILLFVVFGITLQINAQQSLYFRFDGASIDVNQRYSCVVRCSYMTTNALLNLNLLHLLKLGFQPTSQKTPKILGVFCFFS